MRDGGRRGGGAGEKWKGASGLVSEMRVAPYVRSASSLLRLLAYLLVCLFACLLVRSFAGFTIDLFARL